MDWRTYLSDRPADTYIYQQEPYEAQTQRAARWLKEADAVLIGAGAGLSTAAGLNYGGQRFTENFGEFIERYGQEAMPDMYAAGFYPFPTEEERWGYWSRHALVNRIEPEGLPLYRELHELVKAKEHFVLTTNVDHQFWKAGFDDNRIFATQGDYGLIQCKKGCHNKTYDATELFVRMDRERKDCKIPSGLVPRCPVCGGPMTMNLRCDQYFVEDENWEEAATRYEAFLTGMEGKQLVLLECGVGLFNTPVIIRFPFEHMMASHPDWSLIRLNLDEAVVPESLTHRSAGISMDIARSILDIKQKAEGIQ